MKLNEQEVQTIKEALYNSRGAYDALKTVGVDTALPGYEACVERLEQAIKVIESKVVSVPDDTKDVHTEHCCKNCGCKYGDDRTGGCSVRSEHRKQSFKCGQTGVCGDW